MQKNFYEISVWDDILKEAEFEQPNPEDASTVIKVKGSQYEEQLLAIIGSSTMTAPQRAFSPKFDKDINGSYNLSFKLYTRYYDNDMQAFVDNPFLKYLVNERKIKLKYKNKWYDFVIKNVEEDSSDNSYYYTAEALFVNELSSNGFNITFDDKLENNVGTIQELSKEVLKGTDWQLDEENSDLIQERQEEPLIAITLKEEISATNAEKREEKIIIPSSKVIYAFYSCLTEQEKYFQFVYSQDGHYTLTDDNVISNGGTYFIPNINYVNGQPDFAKTISSVPSEYRGKKYIRKSLQKKDVLTNEMVDIYRDTVDQQEVYVSTKTEYLQPTLVKNYITNPKNFTHNDGWYSNGEKTPFPDFYPPIDETKDLSTQLANAKSYLKVSLEEGKSLWNSGITDNRYLFVKNGIAENEEYSLRIKGLILKEGVAENLGQDKNILSNLNCFVASYQTDKDNLKIIDKYFQFKDYKIENGFVLFDALALKSLTYTEMLKTNVGIFFEQKILPYKGITLTYYFEDIQFFKKYLDNTGKRLYPDSEIKLDDNYKFYPVYTCYKPNSLDNQKAKNKADISYCYIGEKLPETYTLLYDENYTKKRSIKISKSNIFNILQELCETFECWMDFEILHDEATGKILKDKKTGRQLKKVRIKKYITKNNYSGFKYGINLKSIKRTINSDDIVSKIIVENNSNEFAKDGFCSISRARTNPSGESFLFNFKHYYTQGLLNYQEVMNDLYAPYDEKTFQVQIYLCYYSRLKKINQQRLEIFDKIGSLSNSIDELTAFYNSYKLIVEEANVQLLEAHQELNEYHPGFTYESYFKPEGMSEEDKKKVDEYLKLDPMITELITTINVLEQKKNTYINLRDNYDISLQKAQKEYDSFSKKLEEIFKEKEKINKEFYCKYSRFIQEGSWIDENYIDDDLYYYDAENVLNTSANPLVTYDIRVMEVSQLQDLENYNFDIGDITTIEDTEFFGWSYVEGILTPVQQEIIISNIGFDLDNPANNIITVKNYKTKFEDLFQRISATTADLKYNEGSYNRAAGVVTPNGQINTEMLQSSLAHNSFVLSNSSDQSVIWDEKGITVSSLKSPNSVVRIINGGIYITSDGGSNWSSAITGYGINANYLNAGQIDTSLIRIMNGAFPTFRWDSNGISAYSYTLDSSTGKIKSIDSEKFVRLDQYGLYGFSNADSVSVHSLQEIKDKADFSLTWDGFSIKNTRSNGTIEISKDNDILISRFDNDSQKLKEKIKIGNLSNNENSLNYGIRINDNNGNPILETSEDGKLWLKKALNITSNNYNIQIGYLDLNNSDKKTEKENLHRTININDNFIVWEDGSMQALKGEFSGTIHANGGSIGNLQIAELQNFVDGTKGIKINSKEGNTFKKKPDNTVFPSQLNLKIENIGINPLKEVSYVWEGSSSGEIWTKLPYTGKYSDIYQLKYEDIKSNFGNGIYYIKATCKYKEETQTGIFQEKIYDNIFIATLSIDGNSSLSVSIVSTLGDSIKNSEGVGILYANSYLDNLEIDPMPQFNMAINILPKTGKSGEYCWLLDKNKKTATLWQFVNSNWASIPLEEKFNSYYKWTINDSSNLPSNFYLPEGKGQKVIYVDNTIINKQNTFRVEITT